MKQMENIGLIRKIAWSFHSTTGLEFDDLVSQAIVYYYEGLEKYDPSRGKITTYMWYWLDGCMKNYIARQAKINSVEVIDIESNPVDVSGEVSEFFDSLTPAAQYIADMVLTAPGLFIKLNKKAARQRVVELLTRQGWDAAEITLGLNDLKLAFLK
jgi:RNA polymerase sigma factor (sigma-70 family)